MRRIVLTALALLMIAAFAENAPAQTPYLQIYFDENLTETFGNCPESPPGTVLDTLYVVAHNFNAWLNAIEFRIDYPPQILWLGDIYGPNELHIGDTYQGVGVAWTIPFNAFVPNVVLRVLFIWNCQYCEDEDINQVLCFNVYPQSGYLRAVRWPDLAFIYGQSGTAVICPTCGAWQPCDELPVPVEQTTWGGVKALYQ